MTIEEAFKKALIDNRNDDFTRSVYADWLDENGEHERANAHRKWPEAREWLTMLADKLETDIWRLVIMGHKKLEEKEHYWPEVEDYEGKVEMEVPGFEKKFWYYWNIYVNHIILPEDADVPDSPFVCPC